MGVRGVEGMISLGIGFTATNPLNLQGIVGSTPLGHILGSYTEAFTAATSGGLTRLGLDLFGAPILYKVNKDIYPTEHVVGEFSKRYLAFTFLTRAAEVTGSIFMYHFLDNHTDLSKNLVLAANGKIILPLFLIAEPILYTAMVLRENPLRKVQASINHAAKATGNFAANAKQKAVAIGYSAVSYMTQHITL